MSRFAALAAAALGAGLPALACKAVGTDLDAVVAIAVGVPDSAVLEEGDTLVPYAIAYNGRGDSVAADIAWAAIDTALITVLDSTTGATINRQTRDTTAGLQARVGNLRSATLRIRLRPRADTLFASGAIRDTVVASTSADSLSVPLTVHLQADTGGILINLANRIVTFTITYPSGTGAFTLQPQDTVPTTTGGMASVRARLLFRTLPDSVVITAQARRATGELVPGSPVTFVVEYVP